MSKLSPEQLMEFADACKQLPNNSVARIWRGLAMASAFSPECQEELERQIEGWAALISKLANWWEALPAEVRATVIAEAVLREAGE